MPRVHNPYFAGPPATQPDTFFGRQDVLQFVDDALSSSRQNLIVFYGQRRIGKTSILHQIARRNKQDYAAVFFDLQSGFSNSASELLYGLARAISSELKLSKPSRADFENDPDFFQTEFLPQVHTQLGQKRLILLLDEFDVLSLETNTGEIDNLPFVQALNHIIQNNNNQLVLLFVIGRRLKELPSQQLQVFRGALSRQINLLEKETTLQLIRQPAQDTLNYQDEAVEHIWKLTGGHPYFTQLLCHEIFNQAQRRDDWQISKADVEAAVDNAVSAGQSALEWFWDEVSLIERFTLYTLSQPEFNGSGASLDQLIAQRNAQGVQIPDFELRALPDRLVDREVLKRDLTERYGFAVELVRRWIAHAHSLEEVTSELIRSGVAEPAKDFFRAGQAAYREEDFALALDNFSRALSINPDYVEARLWLARTRLKKDDLLDAIDEFTYVERFGGQVAREARLGLADARAKYGFQLEQDGCLEEAILEYKQALEIDSQHSLANAQLSEIYNRQADAVLDSQGVEVTGPLYEQALRYGFDNDDLETRIIRRLEQYSRAEEEAKNWEEAEQAERLAGRLMSTADDSREALLRIQLNRARWHLDQQQLEAATAIYQEILADDELNAPRQIIENDILRYSQQQEEQTNWSQAEASLTLLVTLFSDNFENQSRLIDSLCRQGDYFLEQNNLPQAKVAYQHALAHNPENQSLRHLIRSVFQTYRQQQSQLNNVEAETASKDAMQTLVAIVGQNDMIASRWLSEAKVSLGDALVAEERLTEAQAAYEQAVDDITYVLQFAKETDQISSQERAAIWLKLAQLDLHRARFDPALENFERALTDATSEQEIVARIKAILKEYRQQQEQIPRWNRVERAVDMLNRLFPDDEDARFETAQARADQADWHLSRAIPDLEAALRLAHGALLDTNLSYAKSDLIAAQLKTTFHQHCLQQEQLAPPNWKQAEQTINSLVSLLPGDDEVNSWLAETRIKQGNWYLAQQNQSAVQNRHALQQAAEAYRRALKDLPQEKSIVTRLLQNFKEYRQRQQETSPPAWPLAIQALQIVAELIPGDRQVEQWLADTYLKQGAWLLQQTSGSAEAKAYLVEAAQSFRQAIDSQPADKTKLENELLSIFDDYCQRQAQLNPPRWSLAEEALVILAKLLPESPEIRQYQADLHLARGDWLLAQADVDLAQVKNSYGAALQELAKPNDTLSSHIQQKLKSYRLAQQELDPPNWARAEQVVAVIVELLPDDDEANWQLAELNLERGNWLLQHSPDDLEQAEALLLEAEQYYRQALEALPQQQETLLAQLKEDFKQYRLNQLHHQPPRWQLAEKAMYILAQLTGNPSDAQRQLADVWAAWGRSYLQIQPQTPAELEQNFWQAQAIYQRANSESTDSQTELAQLIKDDLNELRLKCEQFSPPHWALAEQAMVILTELLPTDSTVQGWLADNYLAQGRYFISQAQASGGWRRDTQQTSLLEQGRVAYEQAVGAAARRAQIAPSASIAEAWQQLALNKGELAELYHYELKDQDAAQSAYRDGLANWQKAIEAGIDPLPYKTIAATYVAYGDILLERGDLVTARENYLAAEEFFADDAIWLNDVDNRLQAYQDRQRHPGFQRQVVEAGELRYQLQPDNSEIWQALATELVIYGRQFLNENEFGLAKPLYERAMQPASATITLNESNRQRLSQSIVQAVSGFIDRQEQAGNRRQAEEAEEWLNEVEFIERQTVIPEPPPKPLWMTRWGMGAIATGLVLLCSGVGLAMGTAGPLAPIMAAIAPATPTTTPTLTASPTSSPTFSPTATPSQTATATSTAVPETPTPVVVVVTASATPTETSAPTTTPSSTVTQTPSSTATSTPTPYPFPQIIQPADGEILQGAEGLHQLAWQPVTDEQLDPGQFYFIELEYLNDGQETRVTQLQTETTWTIPSDLLLAVDGPQREVSWQVSLVSSFGDVRSIDPLSEPSELRRFSWERIPLPPGQSLSVEINPRNSNEVLAILRAEGIYRSRNGGVDWRPVWPETSVESLHIAPANPNTIYAGSFARVIKSEDGGQNWTQSAIPASAQVYGIATDPNSADIVVAASGESLFISTDGGHSWTTLDRAKSGQVLNTDFYSIVAANTPQGNRVYVAGQGDQVYWRGTRDTVEPWETLVCKVCARSIYSLAINGQKLLAGADEGRLGFSTNLGNDWIRADTPHRNPTLKFSTIVFDPNDSSLVYAGSGTNRNPTDGEGLFRSTDGGRSWEFFNTWNEGIGRGTFVQDIAIDASDSDTIFIATSKGLFRTDNGGKTWTKQ